MIRIATLAVLAVIALPAAGASAAAPHAYRARLSRCHHALTGIDRSFHLTASMRPIRASHQMGVRLTLLVRRTGASTWTPLRADGFGTWYRSDRDADGFRYLRTVNNLAVPAAYRVGVAFRWYGAHGHALRTRHAVTRGCSEPDLRPDLHVRGVSLEPLGLRRDRYRVTVRNRGRTAAGPFDVQLSVGGVLVTRSVAGLAPGEQTRVGFGARPACDAAAPPTVTLDPAGSVDEADEADDVVSVRC
jgi:CARDB protein